MMERAVDEGAVHMRGEQGDGHDADGIQMRDCFFEGSFRAKTNTPKPMAQSSEMVAPSGTRLMVNVPIPELPPWYR